MAGAWMFVIAPLKPAPKRNFDLVGYFARPIHTLVALPLIPSTSCACPLRFTGGFRPIAMGAQVELT
jgi:hypothetical protein